MAEKTFSTILYVDQPQQFPAAVDSLGSWAEFERRVQLIVVDPHASEQVRRICADLPNAQYLALPGEEMPAAYNLGLERAGGEYIGFALASARCSSQFYPQAEAAFQNPQVQMVSALPLYLAADGTAQPYGGSCKPEMAGTLVDLTQSPRQVQLILQAYLFRSQALKDRRFDPQLHDDALLRLLLELQMEHPAFFCLPLQAEYRYTVPLEDQVSPNLLQLCPWWYCDSMERFILPVLETAKQTYGAVPAFVQHACYYLIYSKLNCNLNARTKGVLAERAEVERFWALVDRATAALDDEILMKRWPTGHAPIGRALRFYLLRRKAVCLGRELRVSQDGKRFLARILPPGTPPEAEGGFPSVSLGQLKRESLRIRVMNCREGRLEVYADVLLGEILPPERFQAYVISSAGGNKTRYDAEKVEDYPLIKYFDVTLMRRHTVCFSIPLADAQRQKLRFCFDFEGVSRTFQLTFSGANARLGNDLEYAYWMARRDLALIPGEKNTLILRKANWRFCMKREHLYRRELREKAEDPALARRGLRLRRLYWLGLPFLRGRKLWVTYDKLYKAGDNGEYLFQYLRRAQPRVNAYYIAEPDCPDYGRLKQQHGRHILAYGSLRCLLYALTAQVILSTHTDTPLRFDPEKKLLPYYRDLMGYRTVCIQHGLTIQQIAQYQNRLMDNTELYCLASPYELENVSRPIYGYPPQALRLTGLARYDGLVDQSEKMILITPSWRRNVTLASTGGVRHPKNEHFRETDYFKIYNALINDPALLDCARRTGYRIVYLLHPALSAQAEDFDGNDLVELIPAAGGVSYEQMLTQASLMVTDYSGVQFDFAYMRKPVLYYHPAQLPPHYESGGLDYATMGFGPICTDHEQVVDALCRAMERGCANLPEYVRRADDFFSYSDHNNCQRIYQTVRDWLDGGK